jgi:flagellar biosynthesis protein FlhF
MVTAIPRAEREVFLVIPATLKGRDAEAVLESFAPAEPDKLIFSKLDETFTYGSMFTLKTRTDLPAAYFTTGQRVPEDIEVASPGRFARLVMAERRQGDAA